MNHTNSQFLRFSRGTMRIFLFVYLYGLGFSVLHHHDGAMGMVCLENGQDSASRLPNPHTEAAGGFHECSFLSYFFQIHQSSPSLAPAPFIKAEVHEVAYSEGRLLVATQFRFNSNALRAPPLFS